MQLPQRHAAESGWRRRRETQQRVCVQVAQQVLRDLCADGGVEVEGARGELGQGDEVSLECVGGGAEQRPFQGDCGGEERFGRGDDEELAAGGFDWTGVKGYAQTTWGGVSWLVEGMGGEGRGGGRTVGVSYTDFFPEPAFARLRLRDEVLGGLDLLPAAQIGDFAGGERRLRGRAVGGDGERCGGRGGGRVETLVLESGAQSPRRGGKTGRETGDEEARHCGVGDGVGDGVGVGVGVRRCRCPGRAGGRAGGGTWRATCAKAPVR